MTIASSTAVEFKISDLVLLAYRESALVGPYQDVTTEQQAWAAKLLQLIVDKLSTKGLFAKTVEFVNVALTSGTFQYTVDADAVDIIGAGAYIDPSQADLTKASGETPVLPILRDEWQMLTAKDSTGRPVKYYLHRDASPPVIYLWPIPSSSEAGGHIRFEKHRLRASNLDPTKTADFERYWSLYFVFALAERLSFGSALPMDRVAYLNGKAEQALADCIAYSKQRPIQRFVIRHRGYN